jgi:hypothetical protein
VSMRNAMALVTSVEYPIDLSAPTCNVVKELAVSC